MQTAADKLGRARCTSGSTPNKAGKRPPRTAAVYYSCSRAVEGKGPEALSLRHELDAVHVDVPADAHGAPLDDLRDVAAGHRHARGGALIDLVGLARVAAEAGDRKLRFRVARLDGRDAHALAEEVAAHREAHVVDEGLGAAVDLGVGQRVTAGHAADVHDVAALPVDHAWKHELGGVQQAEDVGPHHLLPLVDVALPQRLQTQRAPGVVHQDVGGREVLRQARDCVLHGFAVGHVHVQAQGPAAQFLDLPAHLLELAVAAAGQNKRRACVLLGEEQRGRAADAAGGASDQQPRRGHGVASLLWGRLELERNQT
eukprot:CAMPEP_0183484758 /NCGR_PEP_ID=MMETSP0370-20130417/179075_1 /TAXON_ID=268820 /ORGANISM="Peridinium aciculiferum, Strain PAER-2" /LENGTH=313 /DNA_ID=CAMNT_0025678051 /DNA_START=377 /DNA_END=1314 /DNA_ORIENTATION=+